MKQIANSLLTYIIGITVILNYCILIPYELDLLIWISILLLVFLNLQNIINTMLKMYHLTIIYWIIVIYWFVSYILYTDINLEDLRYVTIVYILILIYKPILKSINVYKYMYIMGIFSQLIAIINLNKLDRLTFFFLDHSEFFEIYSKKNGIGPVLSVFGIFFLYDFLFLTRKKVNLIFFLFIFNAVILFHTRSSILGLSIVLIVLMYFYFRRKKYTKFLVFLNIIGLFFIYILINYNKLKYSVASISFEDINELSSYRFVDYSTGYHFFENNPFFGITFRNVYRQLYEVDVHNLWLRTLFNGGILYFSVFSIFVYLILKEFKKSFNHRELLVSLLFYGFTISCLEMFAPIGTGTTYFFYWIIMIYIMENQKLDSSLRFAIFTSSKRKESRTCCGVVLPQKNLLNYHQNNKNS